MPRLKCRVLSASIFVFFSFYFFWFAKVNLLKELSYVQQQQHKNEKDSELFLISFSKNFPGKYLSQICLPLFISVCLFVCLSVRLFVYVIFIRAKLQIVGYLKTFGHFHFISTFSAHFPHCYLLFACAEVHWPTKLNMAIMRQKPGCTNIKLGFLLFILLSHEELTCSDDDDADDEILELILFAIFYLAFHLAKN